MAENTDSSSTPGLLERIADHVVICDGGMGTQLMEAGLTASDCGVLWNVEKPGAIGAIHGRYIDAGCELVTTNTFQSTRTALAMHGLDDRAGELAGAAVKLALKVASEKAAATGRARALVLADVGPFGGFLEPLGETSATELFEIFTEQLTPMREAGADAVVVETMSDAAEMRLGIESARALGDWPVIATYAFEKGEGERGFHTMMGLSPADAIKTAADAGADVVGANCGSSLSLSDYVSLADALVKAAGGRPVIVQPNAGTPQIVEGRTVHPATPGEVAKLAVRLMEHGVRVIGGCCGTTPAHLREMAKALGAG